MFSIFMPAYITGDILPKNRVVASCLPQLSPVKSSRASFVNILRPCQSVPIEYSHLRDIPLCIFGAI
jgi:hypothetical protein